MATKPVKHFFSSMAGAPVLSGSAGSLIAVLDACLVNGFNQLTLDSLVVAGNVLTGAKAGHGFVVDQVVATTANEAALTGEWTVTSVTANSFQAAAPGVANVSGTGTLSAKAAGAGWIKAFSGTNKAAYKSADPTSVACYLRVDDTGTTSARVVGYESMTDVDTGTGPFPTVAQLTGGGYWYKSNAADSTTRSYVVVADGLTVYFKKDHNVSSSCYSFDGFGDFVSEKPGDAFSCFLAAQDSTSYINAIGYSQLAHAAGLSGAAACWSPRSYSQIGSAVKLETRSLTAGSISSGISGGLAYPSPASNGLIVSPPAFIEQSGPLRCKAIPGLFHTPQALPLVDKDKIANVSGLAASVKLLMLRVNTSGVDGRIILDITGPWR